MLAWRSGFYGYVNILCTFLVFTVNAEPYYALSVLTPYMAKDMGWSATQFGAAFSVVMLLLGVCSPAVGVLIVRHGPRLALIGGALLASLTMVLLSMTTSLWQFYLFSILLGVTIAVGGALAAQQMVNNWFFRRRALFLGLVMAGGGVGGALVAPAVQSAVNITGSWRTAWLLVASVAFIMMLVAILFLRNKPEELGQEVDGVSAAEISKPALTSYHQIGQVYKSENDWSVKAAVRTKAFWLIMMAVAAQSWALQATIAHQVAYFRGEVGIDATVAAAALGLMTGFSVFGRVFAGWLGDRFEPRLVMGGCLVLMTFSLILLLSWRGLLPLYFYVALFGIAYGGIIVPKPVILVNYFGVKNFASIMGVGLPITYVFGGISPLVAGAIRDATGTYIPAFVVMTGVCILGTVCAFSARPPVLRTGESVSVLRSSLPS